MTARMEQLPRVCVLSDYTLREFNPAVYFPERVWKLVKVKTPLVEFFQKLDASGEFDVFLNLCDGNYEKKNHYSGIDVVKALEEVNLPFTGASSMFYDPTREEMQAAAERCHIGFACGGHVTGVPEAEALSQRLKYPLMVKHPNSFGSTGMTGKSRVKNLGALKSQVKRLCEKFGSARVEEFIDGREFTVMVCDNPADLRASFVYPPAEIIFPEGETFLHVHVKWQKWVYLKPVPDVALAQRLMEMTRKIYLELGGAGYARADIRLREDGELVMIEINPNPGILFKPEHFGPADVTITYDRDGHAGFFERILRSAVLRRDERMVRYSVPDYLTLKSG